MNEENTRHLIKSYPNLYQGYKQLVTQSLMAFGFECGDGWFKLIDELSKELEPLGVVVAQVKEKWGGLRFYTDSVTDEADELISRAEDLSYTICEVCGAPGKLRGGGWVRTLCSNCYEGKK